MKKIAIQGIRGSFHDIAAHQYFKGEELRLVCCDTFEDVFRQMRIDSACLGMVAIENTIAGSLLHNYELLRESGMSIVGEHKLHVEHSLMCLPDDTAGAAEQIAREQLRGHAAVCHADAAGIYGLKVLARGIEDNKHNFTRFLVLADPWQAEAVRQQEEADKSSIVFALPHEEGSLSQVLSIFSFYKINLTKIQSLPIIGHEWEYLFYVDVVYSDSLRFRQSVDALRPLTRALKILGEYKGSVSVKPDEQS
ncbi:MAG: prephenate dehydratase [Bacteroidales bacterium]